MIKDMMSMTLVSGYGYEERNDQGNMTLQKCLLVERKNNTLVFLPVFIDDSIIFYWMLPSKIPSTYFSVTITILITYGQKTKRPSGVLVWPNNPPMVSTRCQWSLPVHPFGCCSPWGHPFHSVKLINFKIAVYP